jgi:hypothetical protein
MIPTADGEKSLFLPRIDPSFLDFLTYPGLYPGSTQIEPRQLSPQSILHEGKLAILRHPLSCEMSQLTWAGISKRFGLLSSIVPKRMV